MEPTIWSRLKAFVQQSLTEKFKAFFPGVCMGFIGAQHLLWIGVPITLVEYAFKFIGTVAMSFFSGLATSYAAYLIEKYKAKNNEKPQKKRENGKRDKAA
jgi:hypothetical protein